ncbi:uncharacterized protein N7482_004157 [Penicillium canariense]|uniref:Uncharacterized protein n=1 Tax=Penicillium canariense TaxID=189055 RepID=A0A9W9LQ99_9EURO|nr:uncharacterized protein N7482_004157 [Penicillium canariense]KAJ5168563.1 hypothetical protein N7482_004157 [Penicillium canariense]
MPSGDSQTNIKTPSLMQRPQSCGIDMTGFSFTRPANQPKGFSLPALPRLSHLGHASLADSGVGDTQKQITHHARKPRSSNPIADPGQQSLEQYLGKSTSSPQSPPLGCSHNQVKEPRVDTTSTKQPENPISREQIIIDLEPGSDTALTTRAIVDSGILPTKSRLVSSHSVRDRKRVASDIQNFFSPRAPARPKDEFRISKSRRENLKAFPGQQQRSISSNKSGVHPLTEENLFELLIGRIKQREENEAAAANIQRHIEIQNLQLKEETQDLRTRLKVGQLHLQEKDTEIKKHQNQLENWKSKLRKFKQVVDEIGHDHDALKEETDQLKAAAANLEKEKNDLLQATEDVNLQISRAEGRIDEQREKIAENEKCISLLQQTLTTTEDQKESTQAELIKERNRNTALESYIQNYALAQAKQIGLVREGQAKLLQEVTSGLGSIAKNATISKDSILSETRAMFDECRASIQTLSEECSYKKVEIEGFTADARDAASRIDGLAMKLTDSVDNNTKVNVGVSGCIQESLHAIHTHVGINSQLFKQLADCDTSYGRLKDKFETVGPTLNNLNALIKSTIASESKLARQIEDLGEKLEEAQMPKGNPELEGQLMKKLTENTQLQLELERMSSEVDSLKQQSGEKNARIRDLQQSLAETIKRQETAADRSQRLEIENTALRGQVELSDQRARHELTTEHAASRDQMKSQFEQQLQIIQVERDELKNGTTVIMNQLSGVQNALIEAKELVDEQRKLHEAMAKETEQEIQQLTKSCTEHTARVDSQTLEIQKYQESEVASCMERNDLQEQLRKAQERIHELEQTLVTPAGLECPREPSANIVPFATIESRFSPQRATSPYGDPGAFAMLFMSDEFLLSTPLHKGSSNRDSPSRPEDVMNDSQTQPEVVDPAKVFDIPPDIDPPPPRINTKRKAVNFAPRRIEGSGGNTNGAVDAQTTSTEVQNSTRAEKDVEERINKLTKHTHKWTYSRSHASNTQSYAEQVRRVSSLRAASEKQVADPMLEVAAGGVREGVATVPDSVKKAEYSNTQIGGIAESKPSLLLNNPQHDSQRRSIIDWSHLR